jgi:hypothetical protein
MVTILGEADRRPPEATLRLLYCLVCKTLEELPPFDGRPENDTYLMLACEGHVFPSGDPHKGRLFRLPVAYWANEEIRKGIIDQIKGGGSKGLDEVDPDYYASRSTFAEDALKCYQRHQRPTDGCSEYMDSSKILLPKTAVERKELGLPSPKNAPGPKVFLCTMCPIHSIVTTRKRALLGLYK